MNVFDRIAGNVSSAARSFWSVVIWLYSASFWIRSVFARVTAAFRSASFCTTMFCLSSSDTRRSARGTAAAPARSPRPACAARRGAAPSQSDASFDEVNLNSRFCSMYAPGQRVGDLRRQRGVGRLEPDVHEPAVADRRDRQARSRNRSMTPRLGFRLVRPRATRAGGAALNHPDSRADRRQDDRADRHTVVVASFGLNCGWFHSCSASIVRRASARLCRILYCVW